MDQIEQMAELNKWAKDGLVMACKSRNAVFENYLQKLTRTHKSAQISLKWMGMAGDFSKSGCFQVSQTNPTINEQVSDLALLNGSPWVNQSLSACLVSYSISHEKWWLEIKQ